MFKFVHAADIHLDSPLLNLEQYEGAPVDALRVATRDAFDNLVDLTIQQQARFLLIAGDLYNNESRDFHTPTHVRRKMEELREHNIDVFLVQGNHDAEGEARKAFGLTMPGNVHRFPTHKPATLKLDDVQTAIHGQGFAQRAVAEDLSAHFPAPAPGYLNIGLLHTNCGANPAHDPYAPSTVNGLSNKGYQYWALGHIHKRNTDIGPHPHIVYPGNTQGRNIRETGPKGCVVVAVESGAIDSLSFHATDTWRWQVCRVDAARCDTPDDVLARACDSLTHALAQADGRSLAVRIEVSGASAVHRQLWCHAEHWRGRLRLAVLDRFDDRVWVERIKFRTQPLAMRADDAERDDLMETILRAPTELPRLDEVRGDLEKLIRELPTDPRLGDLGFDFDDDETLAGLVEEARGLLAARLLGAEEPS